MSTRVLLGMLTPSSNTTLEPVTTQMVAALPEVSVHFGRFPVTEIALSDKALRQFDDRAILPAAEMLSHTRVQCIGWSGTAAGWLGFEADERLCRRITEATGIAACTSVLALNEIFRLTGVERFGLVTPYRDEVQRRIMENYAAAGFACVAEQHLGIQDNFAFSEVSDDQIITMTRRVAQAKPQAITIFCTNLRGAPLVEALERELGIPVYDTVATVVWKALQIAGIDAQRMRGWGRLFRDITANNGPVPAAQG
ncbi:MAG: aspartate/glutamate racemase family protein [Gammaproteobacteria bacterium]